MDSSVPLSAATGTSGGRSTWINGPRWDIGWLIGSAAIIPIVLFFVWRGASSDVINLGTTAIIGGPHLFATYTATYMDPRFRKKNWPVLLAASIVIPAFVIFWTFFNFQILLSVFIFAASIHVLHQNAYLTDIYRRRAGVPEPKWSRLVDYGLLMLCIYPIAAYKLVHSDFKLGDVEILIPPFLKVPATYYLVWIAFTGFLSAWLVKTFGEWRRGLLNVPKTLLIATTCGFCFFVPVAATGERLELAFQAVNAWHSIQYLGIVWYVQKVRKEHGLIDSRFIQKISGSGRASWYFYGFCFAITMVLFGVLVSVASADPFGISFPQYYYMGVLSCLLIHYALDGYLFTVSNRGAPAFDTVPYSVPGTVSPDVALAA